MKPLIINEEIPGWKDRFQLVEAAKLVQQLPENAKIVEVGSGFGCMTWVLSKNAPKDSIIYAIDIWDGGKITHSSGRLPPPYYANYSPHYRHTKEEFLKQTKDCDNIIPIRKEFPFEWKYGLVDMVCIDANHSYEQQSSYIKSAFEIIKPNGIIWGDDYYPPGICRRPDELGSQKYETMNPGIRQAVEEMAILHNKRIFNPGETCLWIYF